MNRSYSQNTPFDTMKTRHRFGPHGGAKRALLANLDIDFNQRPKGLLLALWAWMLGREPSEVGSPTR